MDKKQGTLHDLKDKPEFHWKTSRLWIVDMMIRMSRAVFTLHNLNIIHTDLKLENFLMENNFYPVLSDFGFSFDKTLFDEDKIIINEVSGTENYFAPELKKRDKKGKIRYSFASDIYSLGVCFFFLSIKKMY